jgi:hypothetical protein
MQSLKKEFLKFKDFNSDPAVLFQIERGVWFMTSTSIYRPLETQFGRQTAFFQSIKEMLSRQK